MTCYCGGGDPHPWRPHGGGARILAYPPGAPQTQLGADAEAEAGKLETKASNARISFVRRWYKRRAAIARQIAREELQPDA
jgi:hypothetical protein